MLSLPEALHRRLREQLERTYPEEGCGILMGRRGPSGDEVVRIIPTANMDPEPLRRYSISPLDVIAAQASSREDRLEILGFYHSHPDHPAAPSESDLREAHWLGCVYMICEVQQGRLTSIAAVRLAASGQWAEERVRIEPPEPE